MLKNVLVTGGAGFIGIHTSLLLLERGYKVTIIDSLVNSYLSAVNRLKEYIKKNKPKYFSRLNFYKGDVRDINFIRKIDIISKFIIIRKFS